MKHLFHCLMAAGLCLSLASYSAAQTTTKTDHKKPHTEKMASHAGGKLEQARLQEEWNAWCKKLDPKDAAPFYAKGTGHVFYDLAPLKYDGWDEYEKGAAQLLANFKSAKCSVNDVDIHNAGDWAWVTAIVHLDLVGKDDKPEPLDTRWTSIWQRQGGEWLIAHEHVSVPMK
jgi:ketosteroid isomerase-like protein